MKKTLAALFVAALLLPSAVFGANTKTEFTIVNGAEPGSLDPAHAQANTDNRIYQALFEGLVIYDPKTNEARPGLAESWTIGADGKTYTFKLRKTTWSDGTPITAQTVVDSWIRELDPKTAGEYADFPAGYIAGAQAFKDGKGTSAQVQIKAVSDLVFQVTFNAPLPTLSLLGHYSFGVVPVHTIAKHGKDWTLPANFVGNGPFVLKEWVPQSKIVVVSNPKYWDAKAVKLTKITFLPISDSNTAYKMFQAGEIDWATNVPIDQLDDASLRPEYQNAPYISVYYYSINLTPSGVKELKDVRVRQALSMAMDRATLVKRVSKAGEVPATSFTPPVSTYVAPKVVKDDIAAAQKLLAEAGFPGGKGFPKITLLYNTLDSHKKIAEYIQSQWKNNLGIEIELQNKEFKTAVADRNAHQFQIARAGWAGDYADPMTFLDLWVNGNVNNDAGYNNPKYDALIDKAKAMQEGPDRFKVLFEAESMLLADLPILPIYFTATKHMIDTSKWSGWYTNSLDIHPWKFIGPKN